MLAYVCKQENLHTNKLKDVSNLPILGAFQVNG